MSNVPGINAKHAIITPTCRENRTDHGAWLEAVDRLQQEYQKLLKARGEDGAHYHLVLSVEARKPLTAMEKLRNIQDALNDDDGPAPDQDYDEPSAVELYESTKDTRHGVANDLCKSLWHQSDSSAAACSQCGESWKLA